MCPRRWQLPPVTPCATRPATQGGAVAFQAAEMTLELSGVCPAIEALAVPNAGRLLPLPLPTGVAEILEERPHVVHIAPASIDRAGG